MEDNSYKLDTLLKLRETGAYGIVTSSNAPVSISSSSSTVLPRSTLVSLPPATASYTASPIVVRSSSPTSIPIGVLPVTLSQQQQQQQPSVISSSSMILGTCSSASTFGIPTFVGQTTVLPYRPPVVVSTIRDDMLANSSPSIPLSSDQAARAEVQRLWNQIEAEARLYPPPANLSPQSKLANVDPEVLAMLVRMMEARPQYLGPLLHSMTKYKMDAATRGIAEDKTPLKPQPLGANRKVHFWTGFFLEIDGIGRGELDLEFTVEESKVTGQGEDPLGPYQFMGTFIETTGNVDIIKQYRIGHTINYRGNKVGNQITGSWIIPGDRSGTFFLYEQQPSAQPRVVPVQPPAPKPVPPPAKSRVSCHWSGIYIEGDGVTKGELECKFDIVGSDIVGSGIDPMGAFKWDGKYNDGDESFSVSKVYSGHEVFYQGKKDNGRIKGTWSISGDRSGTFLLNDMALKAEAIRWVGFFYEADGTGQAPMEMIFDITGSTISSSGADPVGQYTWSGTFDHSTQEFQVTKKYLNAHAVLYKGRRQGNSVVGTWTIPNERSGTFSLNPADAASPPDTLSAGQLSPRSVATSKPVVVSPPPPAPAPAPAPIIKKEEPPRRVDIRWYGSYTGEGNEKGKVEFIFQLDGKNVVGGGVDVVGPFKWTGTVDLQSGVIDLVKKYERDFVVNYQGKKVGNDISGTWNIPGDRSGTFSVSEQPQLDNLVSRR